MCWSLITTDQIGTTNAERVGVAVIVTTSE